MKRTIKILYVIDCGLNAGGAPRSTSILANEMAKMYDVYILMPETGETGNPDIHCIQLKAFKNTFPFLFTQPLQALRLVREVYKVVKELDPDLIHAEMPRGARALGVLKKIGLINYPIIYTEREFVTGLRKVYQWLYGILVAKPYDRIICLSKKAVPFWLKYRKEGVVVIPNPGGIEYDNYSDDDRIKSCAIIENYRPENLNVVLVGRFIKTKRWDLVEDIINLYNHEICGHVHFYIAVAYNEENLETKRFVTRMAANKNVSVYPNADTKTVNALYYTSDIHLVTSSIESFGRTVIEAMARKCVVYSTDAGAISETIGDRHYILSANAKVFVNKLKDAENEKDKLDISKEKMFLRYHKLYSTKANYESNLIIYKELLNIH